MASSKVWLVTGASSGIGAAIAHAVLAAGHDVIPCARNPAKATRDYPNILPLGGEWLKLDVTARDCQETVSEGIKARGGKIDVVVNNAGSLLLGSIEDLSNDEIHESMETNFFGCIRVLKGILPYMRAQKSGIIINVSSCNGLVAAPGAAMYCAGKSALEALSETLSYELAPFNIRVIIAEPGRFRTNIFNVMKGPSAGLSEDYATSAVGQAFGGVEEVLSNPGVLRGDPQKLATRVVEFVNGTGMAKGLTGHLRLVLGADCMKMLRAKLEVLTTNMDAMEKIAASTDCDDSANLSKT